MSKCVGVVSDCGHSAADEHQKKLEMWRTGREIHFASFSSQSLDSHVENLSLSPFVIQIPNIRLNKHVQSINFTDTIRQSHLNIDDNIELQWKRPYFRYIDDSSIYCWIKFASPRPRSSSSPRVWHWIRFSATIIKTSQHNKKPFLVSPLLWHKKT